MLTALEAEPGMRVLEIGTGTGWNTALLAHHLGGNAVVSVEIDPEVSGHARQRLDAHGFAAVTTIVGDGADGWAERAPYDRVLATVAAPVVPYPWVAQTRPGGLVLLPWGTAYYPGGLLRVDVDTNHIGRGRIIGPASFMTLRAQRTPRIGVKDVADKDGVVAESSTEVHPWYLAGDADAATAIGLRVPAVECFYGGTALYLIDPQSRSWAAVTLGDSPHTKSSKPGRASCTTR